MTESAIFDARSWIIANCADAGNLTSETFRVVSGFTLLWNLFENAVCDNEAKVDSFDEIAIAIAEHNQLPDEVREGIRFWTDRYRDGAGFNFLFKGLNFRPRDRRDHVEAVLSGIRVDAHSQLLAVMIIVYRLRNNLFHGLKDIATLNDQVFNLDTACQVLAAVMRASGRLN
jgi:hypothetical protein